MSQAGADRRRNPRVAMAVDVDFASSDNFYMGRARDVSVGGVFIETDVGLRVGVELMIRLKVLSHSFKLVSEVAWVLEGDDGNQVGLGCRFVDPPDDARAAIEEFTLQRPPLRFEMMEPEDDADPVPPPLPKGSL